MSVIAWFGYFEFDGNEVINCARTEAYARDLPWFRPVYNNDNLCMLLGHDRYVSPLVDDAPWVDPNQPESLDFYGFYPLNVTGLEDSTRAATSVESLGNGGIPGRSRHATRSVVFSGVLIAATDAAAHYGMRWLNEATSGGACGGGGNGEGGTMCYLSSEPQLEEVTERGFVGAPAVLDGGFFLPTGDTIDAVIDGGNASTDPTDSIDGGDVEQGGGDEVIDGGSAVVTGDNVSQLYYYAHNDSVILDGGAPGALPDLVIDGGGPGVPTPILASPAPWPFNAYSSNPPNPAACLPPYQRTLYRVGVGAPAIDAKNQTSDGGQAWTVGFTAVAGCPFETGAEVPVIAGFGNPEVVMPWVLGEPPVGGSFDPLGFILVEEPCAETVSLPLYDPTWPQVLAPPAPSNVPLGNYTPPINWRRRQFTVPKQYVPGWGEVVPKISVHARLTDLRTLRLRFYSDPFEVGDISDDPCAYCGDIVISYVPKDHTLVLDGPEESVYVISPGGAKRRAEGLVYKTDGTPFQWPELTCGFGYIVTLDTPQTQVAPVVDLSLFSRAAA